MQFDVYVLWSASLAKTYVGMTSNLAARIHAHNFGIKGWTVRGRPWQLIYWETFTDKRAAALREQHLKSGIGREFLQAIIISKNLR
jgi:putative endonuclease